MHIKKRLINQKTAMSVANFMKNMCYIVIAFFIIGIILSLMGRQQFVLHSPTGTYNYAIYSEKNHDFTSRGPTVSLPDNVYLAVHDGIDLVSQVGISTMYLVTVLPAIFSFYFLAGVFRNVSRGLIFIEKNAKYLLYYGIIQMLAAVVAPFIKLFICFLTNLFTDNILSIGTGQRLINDFIPNLAFIVAAYIIHYGISLQDEVDHTL